MDFFFRDEWGVTGTLTKDHSYEHKSTIAYAISLYLVKLGSVQDSKDVFSFGQIEMFYEELLGARYVDVRPLESVLDGEDAADSALGDLRRKKSKIKSYEVDKR